MLIAGVLMTAGVNGWKHAVVFRHICCLLSFWATNVPIIFVNSDNGAGLWFAIGRCYIFRTDNLTYGVFSLNLIDRWKSGSGYRMVFFHVFLPQPFILRRLLYAMLLWLKVLEWKLYWLHQSVVMLDQRLILFFTTLVGAIQRFLLIFILAADHQFCQLGNSRYTWQRASHRLFLSFFL